jgi:anaerobic carbon-monoxide dehydrogenase iron sulfur subunit
MPKVLMIHPERCTGCQNCELACGFSHEKQFRPAATRVHVYTWEREGFSVPMMCQQCDSASCMKVCPTGALHRARGTTLVEYTREQCIGCRMCTIACAFGNIVYDSVTESVLKCDTCGGDPSCVKSCPVQALEFIDDNVSTRSRKMAYASKFKSAFEGA